MGILLSVVAVVGASFGAGPYEQIIVYRNGKELLVRSSFSIAQDIVIRTHYASPSRMPNEEAYLIPKSAKLLNYKTFGVMHAGGDEIPAYPLPMYGTLGGNHGSPYGRALNICKHGLTAKDLGAELTTEKKGRFYIPRIIDKDNILIHPENQGKPGFPKFAALDQDRLFRNGIELKHAGAKMQQVYTSALRRPPDPGSGGAAAAVGRRQLAREARRRRVCGAVRHSRQWLSPCAVGLP